MKKIMNFFGRNRSSSSSKRSSSHHASQTSVDGGASSRYSDQSSSSHMRGSMSQQNIHQFLYNEKLLDKNKLHKAAFFGNRDKVRQLIHPSLINKKDQQGRTPLIYAVVAGDLDIIRDLLQESARVEIGDSEERTPLMISILYPQKDSDLNNQIRSVLLKDASPSVINKVDTHQRTALHYAAEADDEEAVNLLLSVQQTQTNIPDMYGATPLHLAAEKGYHRIAQALLNPALENPSDPTVRDKHNMTAYDRAKRNNQENCMRILQYTADSSSMENTQRQPTTSHHTGMMTSVILPNAHDQNYQPMSGPGVRSDDQDDDSEPLSDGQIELGGDESSDDDESSALSPRHGVNAGINIFGANPLLPAAPHQRNPPQTTSSVLSGLVVSNPTKPDNLTATKPQTTVPSSSLFGGSLIPMQQNTDSSVSLSVDHPLISANPLARSTLPTDTNKNQTIGQLVNLNDKKKEPSGMSWSESSGNTGRSNQAVKPAQRADYLTSDTDSTDNDDDGNIIDGKFSRTSQPRTPPPEFLSADNSRFNATKGFIPADLNNHIMTDSIEDEEEQRSIEVAVQPKPNPFDSSRGIQRLVNIPPPLGDFRNQLISINPVSPGAQDESSWTGSDVSPRNAQTNQTVRNILLQNPLNRKSSNEPNLDDSRPLSADLKSRGSSSDDLSNNSSSSDDETPVPSKNQEKPSTIANFVQNTMRPYTNGTHVESSNNTIGGLVINNLRPNETNEKENSTNVIDSLVTRNPTIDRRSSSSSNTGRLIVSPMPQRNDSILSSASSSVIDDATNSIGQQTAAALLMQNRQNQENQVHYQNRPQVATELADLRYSPSRFPNDLDSPIDRNSSRTPIHRDFNDHRSSMSSSASSIQNNIDRLSEIKQDINKIERQQEDQLRLKRQLKDMENEKNKFEAMYRKQDEILRSTEAKLEKETSEKQRFEWNSKNLTLELKTVRDRLKGLEEEKEILNQRCSKIKEERDNFDERWRSLQNNQMQSTATALLREEDIEKIKSRHREEMKILSAENEELHQRTKQLQSDLQLHKESLDVTIRYKIDLENAIQEKSYLQHELDRLKQEKELVEHEKIDYKKRYDELQEQIRQIVAERTNIEQKLTNELQEQMKQRQRTTDDVKKYKAQIEQLNLKLGEAEARLLVLQTQNEALLASKDREIKNEFESLAQRLTQIESEKLTAEQRYQNEHRELNNRTTNSSQDPLTGVGAVVSANPLNHSHQHSPNSSCSKCDTLQRSYEKEREQRLQTEKDNDRLRDVLARQRQQQEDLNRSLQEQQQHNEQMRFDDSRDRRVENERVHKELQRLRQQLDDIVSHYEPSRDVQHQRAQIHSQIDNFRQFYENEYKQQPRSFHSLSTENIPNSSDHQNHFHSQTFNHYPHCFNSRLLKERLENAIDTSLAEQRIQGIQQIKRFERPNEQNSATLITAGALNPRRKRNYF